MAGSTPASSSAALCTRRAVDMLHRMMTVNVFPETTGNVISVLVFFSCGFLRFLYLLQFFFFSLLRPLLWWTFSLCLYFVSGSKHTLSFRGIVWAKQPEGGEGLGRVVELETEASSNLEFRIRALIFSRAHVVFSDSSLLRRHGLWVQSSTSRAAL